MTNIVGEGIHCIAESIQLITLQSGLLTTVFTQGHSIEQFWIGNPSSIFKCPVSVYIIFKSSSSADIS